MPGRWDCGRYLFCTDWTGQGFTAQTGSFFFQAEDCIRYYKVTGVQTCALPICRGVHLVTANDYLAQIGAGWMAPIYHFLGLSTGVIVHEQGLVYDPSYTDDTHEDERLRHLRSEERRVEKEWRDGLWWYEERKN